MVALGVAVAVGVASCLLASPVQALDQPVDAVKLVLKRSAGGSQSLVFVSRDPDVLFPAVGSGDDPATGSPGGALLDLFSATEGSAALAVPPGEGTPGWTVAAGGVPRFRFRNPDAPAGVSPVRVVVLKQGRVLRVVAKTTGLPLAVPQLAVGIRITTGTLRTCALFGGTTIQKDVAGKFVAKGALAATLTDCSDASLTVVPCHLIADPFEPMCGGVCPAGETCATEFSPQIEPRCVCHPLGTTSCIDSGYPACGGFCAGGAQCQAFHLSFPEGGIELPSCACVDPANTCDDPAGTCFAVGTCPTGQVCLVQGPPTSACGCLTP
jgi:hypothetical protein